MADFWQRIKQGANDLGASAQRQVDAARQSEAWRSVSESAKNTSQNLKQNWDRTMLSMRGDVKEVIFTEPTLGMTLERDAQSGLPRVSRVDEEGAAFTLGVEVGLFIVAIRAGIPGDGQNEPVIQITSYEQLMGLFPAMGRPVTIFMLTPRDTGLSPVGFTMDEEIRKATRIIQSLTTERALTPDAMVPKAILQQALGLAFIRVAKVGLVLSVKGGSGIVVVRLGESLTEWSAPCAVSTGGVGWGLQLGAEVADFMIVLNSPQAVEAFSSGSQVTLGGNVGVALGPVGRNGGLNANVHGGRLATDGTGPTPMHTAQSYAYSHSKGLFMGISLEGAVIKPRHDINAQFYGGPVSPRQILSGQTPPPQSAKDLYAALDCGATVDEMDGFAPSPSRPDEPIMQPPSGVNANPFSDPDPANTNTNPISNLAETEPSSQNTNPQASSAAQAAANATATGEFSTDQSM